MENQLTEVRLSMHAGSASSLGFEAVAAASRSDFEEAERKLAEAKEELIRASELQIELLESDNGQFSRLADEAQSYYHMANQGLVTAKTLIDLYRRLNQMSQVS